MGTADVSASNGVVHIIDGVLSPPVLNIVELAAHSPDLSTLVVALNAGNLVTTLSGAGPFTVFAPTNGALAKLPKATLAYLLEPANIKDLDDILKYHVIVGAAVYVEPLWRASQYYKTFEGTRLNIEVIDSTSDTWKVHGRDETDYRGSSEAYVIAADVRASNGLVQIIDGVLMPPRKNIVGLASGNADLSTLVTALKAGNLVTALSGCTWPVDTDRSLPCNGVSTVPLTVFAPTNGAFAKLPKATLAYLLEPKNIDKLEDVLKYHVIAGTTVYVKDLKKGNQYLTTLEGKQLHIDVDGPFVNVQKALVITADIIASNGVVHIIDKVLIPAAVSGNIVKLAASTPVLSTLVTALKAGKLVTALSGGSSSYDFYTVFAPSNGAFAKLPKATLASLLEPKNIAQLDDILKYHVIAGDVVVYVKDLKEGIYGQYFRTLEGNLLPITKTGSSVLVQNATVITAC